MHDPGTFAAGAAPGPLELEDRLSAAKRDLACGGGPDRTSESELYGGHAAELGILAGVVAGLVPVAESRSAPGYLSPKHAFDMKLRRGGFEGDPVGGMAARDAAERLARIWDGERSLPGTRLACNAVLLAVLDDPDLRERALESARAWAEELARELERWETDLF